MEQPLCTRSVPRAGSGPTPRAQVGHYSTPAGPRPPSCHTAAVGTGAPPWAGWATAACQEGQHWRPAVLQGREGRTRLGPGVQAGVRGEMCTLAAQSPWLGEVLQREGDRIDASTVLHTLYWFSLSSSHFNPNGTRHWAPVPGTGPSHRWGTLRGKGAVDQRAWCQSGPGLSGQL